MRLNFNIIFVFILFVLIGYGQKKEHNKWGDTTSINHRVKTLTELANYHKFQSLDSVMFYTNTLINLSNKHTSYIGLYQGYLLESFIAKTQNKDALAEIYLQKAITISSNIDEPNLAANAYFVIGMDCFNLNDFSNALKLLIKSEYLFNTQKGVSLIKLKNLNAIAFLYTKFENYEKSLEYLNKILLLTNDGIFKEMQGIALNSLGIIYSELGNYEESLDYFQRAIKLFVELEDDYHTRMSENNKGLAYYYKGDYITAQKILKNTIANTTTEGDDISIYLDGLLYLGKIAFHNKNYEKALAHFALIDNYATIPNQTQVYVRSILERARTYTDMEAYAIAIKLLQKAITISKQKLLPSQTKEAYYLLSVLYDKRNQFENEIISYKEYIRLKDSLENVNNSFNVASLKIRFEFEKVNHKLEEQKRLVKMLYEKDRVKSINNRLLLAFLFLLLVFVIGFIYRHKKMAKMKMNIETLKQERMILEIESKQRQITDFAIHISEKNSLLEEIRNQIKKIGNNNKNSVMRDLLFFIENDIIKNKEKVQLYTNVNNIKDIFYENLTKKYPYLDEKEKKIAMMIRLGHSSKQIALQLNLAPVTINNYRYSLRQKFKLTRDENLTHFIKKI